MPHFKLYLIERACMVPSVVRFQFHSNYVISADSIIRLVALLTLFVQPRPELGPVHEAPRVAHDTFEDALGRLRADKLLAARHVKAAIDIRV